MIVRNCCIWLILLIVFPGSVLAKTPSWLSTLSFPQDFKISAPSAVTIDHERKRYYVVDYNGKKLISFDQNGAKISEFNASGALQKPVDLAFGRSGKMWVVERNSNELLYIDLSSQKIRRFNLKQTTGKQVQADRVACDSKYRLFISDSHSGRIFRLDDNLKVDAVFAAQSDSQLIDFKIKDSTLWALDNRHNHLLKFDLDGNLLKKIPLKADLDFAVSFEVDSKGNIFVMDRPQGKIVVMNQAGEMRYEFGRRGFRRGQFNYATQLAFDWQQRLCVVNQGNNRIEVFSH